MSIAATILLIFPEAFGVSCPQTACYVADLVIAECKHTSEARTPMQVRKMSGLIIRAKDAHFTPIACEPGEAVEDGPLVPREHIQTERWFFYEASHPKGCYGLVGKKVRLFAPANNCIDDNGIGNSDVPERMLEALPIQAQ